MGEWERIDELEWYSEDVDGEPLYVIVDACEENNGAWEVYLSREGSWVAEPLGPPDRMLHRVLENAYGFMCQKTKGDTCTIQKIPQEELLAMTLKE